MKKQKIKWSIIKSLASGGDAMEGRKLYENTISFIPQFTMFLCYNRFYEVVPADAKENLELKLLLKLIMVKFNNWFNKCNIFIFNIFNL